MYISSETDFDNPEEVPYDSKQTKWFVVRANLNHTNKEQEETKEAVRKQIAMGIIQENGLPAGISPEMLGIKRQTPPPPNTQHLRPQQRIQLARLQEQQSNSNLSYLNRPKLTQDQLLYQRFGLRK
jgi:hypothetical protein